MNTADGTPLNADGTPLSAYELERLENIKRNERHLETLGLKEKLLPKITKKPVAKRKSDDGHDPDYQPEPRVTRARTGASSRESVVETDDDSDDEDVPLTKHRRSKQPKGARPPPLDDDDDASGTKCVVVEVAKTGRSKCRCCMEPIAEGVARVGMQSWMVGRQVVVWQHPACFLSQISASEEASGRGKCKQTKRPFAAGERKLTLAAHTTTAHVKLEAAGALLAPVLRAASKVPTFDGLRAAVKVDAFCVLSAADVAALEAGLAKGSSTAAEAKPELPGVSATPSQGDAMAAKDEQGTRQPAAGSVAKATGKVAWKWAGALCFGKLMPSSETATHCFARTQRGNTKTLTKGGAYWWLV